MIIALLPALALGALAFRALRNEEAAVRREMQLELERAASRTRELYAAELSAERPAFSDQIDVTAELPSARRSPSGACAWSDRARILRECPDAVNESGRFVWPLVALDPRTEPRPSREVIAKWLREHGARMASAERAATRLELAKLGLGDLGVLLDGHASSPAQSYLEPRRRAMVAGEKRIVWDDASSRGALELASEGRYRGVVVHPGSLSRAIAAGWPPLGDGMAARLVVGREPRGEPTVELLRGGAWLVIGWADADKVARTAERSRAIVIGAAVAAGVVALLLAALLYGRMRAERRLSALRTDFVAAVSHELRTPIASLRMLSELLAEGRVEASERSSYETALAREAKRLGDTVERLLGFSRMEAKKHVDARSLGSVADVVAQAIDTFEERHPEAAPVTRRLEPISAAIDADGLRMAIDNLLANAHKYAPDGKPYEVSVAGDGDWVRIAARDHGPGIARRDQERIFRPFERVDERLSRATEGSGIGLSLVRHVAKSHGGSATVQSTPEKGATFVLRIPRGKP